MKAALNNGVNHWNAGEFYGPSNFNSMTLLKAYFEKYPEDAPKVQVIIKGAIDGKTFLSDNSPDFLRASINNIIEQLGGTKSFIFGLARRDPKQDFSTTLRIMQEYVDAGKIEGIALSECSVETIHEAAKQVKISALELELSMFSPDILKNGVADAAAKYNIPIVAYSPMGRGFLAGKFKTRDDLKEMGPLGEIMPRFVGDNFDQNVKLAERCYALAEKKGCTPAQLALNWVRQLGQQPGLPTIIPIPGSSSVGRAEENSKVIELSREKMAEIQQAVDTMEAAGDRYPEWLEKNT